MLKEKESYWSGKAEEALEFGVSEEEGAEVRNLG